MELPMTTLTRLCFGLLLWLPLVSLLAPRPLAAAEKTIARQAIRGSVSGFLFDPQAHELRPIVGIPGSSFLGNGMSWSADLDEIMISPVRDYALALSRDHHELVEIRQISSAATVRGIVRGASPIDMIFVSPLGGEAVLYRRAAHTFQLLRNLPDAPHAGEEVEMPWSRGSLTTLAVGDGGIVLAGFSDGESGAIYWIGSGGRAGVVSRMRHPSAITFVSHSHDALVADRIDNKIYLVRNITRNPATIPLASHYDGVDGPVAVEASRDGQRAIVANTHSKTILTLDLDGGSPAVYSCHCVPTALRHLNGNAVFQLTESSPKGPVWLFDGDAPEPRIVFVPPYRAGSSEVQEHQ